jgi:hypothetical protein
LIFLAPLHLHVHTQIGQVLRVENLALHEAFLTRRKQLKAYAILKRQRVFMDATYLRAVSLTFEDFSRELQSKWDDSIHEKWLFYTQVHTHTHTHTHTQSPFFVFFNVYNIIKSNVILYVIIHKLL